MAELVTVEKARMGEWRDVPTGKLRTTYFLESPAGSELPQCFRVENTPHRHLDTHFHTTDQFQVITDGTGLLGGHEVQPFSVHFARAYTPYGPIVAGPQGLAWISIRAQHDDGAQYMPQSRDALLAVPDRDPWQITESLSFDDIPRDGLLHTLQGIHDDEGLGAFALRLGRGQEITLSNPSCSGGQFLVALRGGIRQDGGDSRSLATMWIHGQEAPIRVVAGTDGLDALVLSFPRSKAARRTTALKVNAAACDATKAWQCQPCGFMYDESAGLPDAGIAPGTRFADLPPDWHCPDCSAGKNDFTELEF